MFINVVYLDRTLKTLTKPLYILYFYGVFRQIMDWSWNTLAHIGCGIYLQIFKLFVTFLSFSDINRISPEIKEL